MTSKILSLHGKGLKLDSRADVEPLLQDCDPALVEEVHFGGNTIGVEAAEALAEFLQRATSIKVRGSWYDQAYPYIETMRRLPISQTSSPVA